MRYHEGKLSLRWSVSSVSSFLLLAVYLVGASLASSQQSNVAEGVLAGKYRFKHLYDFCGTSDCKDGAIPNGELIFDAAGNLYGTTEGGGNSACQAIGCGTVFQLSPKADRSWKHTILFEFNGRNGANPPTGLVMDAAENLYGTTVEDSGSDVGTVFRLSPQGDGKWKLTTLLRFDRKNGFGPYGRLVLDASGNLYGTTVRGGNLAACFDEGCGTVFRLSRRKDGTWKHTILFAFNFANGAEPLGGLILDAAGNLYGTTSEGGNSDACGPAGCGTTFRLSPHKNRPWTIKTLHNFNSADGATPEGALVFDHAGSLYGATFLGGSRNGGTDFRLTPRKSGSWDLTTLVNFEGRNGSEPLGGLVFDPAGNLYGTTAADGFFGIGIVYKLSPRKDGTWKQTTLLTFVGENGSGSRGGLLLDAAGNLYGTAPEGGKHVGGVAFELSPRNGRRRQFNTPEF